MLRSLGDLINTAPRGFSNQSHDHVYICRQDKKLLPTRKYMILSRQSNSIFIISSWESRFIHHVHPGLNYLDMAELKYIVHCGRTKDQYRTWHRFVRLHLKWGRIELLFLHPKCKDALEEHQLLHFCQEENHEDQREQLWTRHGSHQLKHKAFFVEIRPDGKTLVMDADKWFNKSSSSTSIPAQAFCHIWNWSYPSSTARTLASSIPATLIAESCFLEWTSQHTKRI